MVALAALAASACLSAPVSYATPPDSSAPYIPWIHAGPVVGYLFYYGADGPWKTRADRVLISTRGQVSGGGVTKILWRVRGGSKAIRIVGKRLDAAGSFRQQFPATPSGGGAFFPSIVNVPTSGCWRVTVSSANRVGRFAFWAVEP
jgi:hypothetical protein